MTLINKIIYNRNTLCKFKYLSVNLFKKCYFHNQTQTKWFIQNRKSLLTIFRQESTNSVKAKAGQSQAITAPNKRLKRSEIRRLMNLAKPEKLHLLGAIGFLLISSTVTMALPFCLGKIIDLIYTADRERMRENLNKVSLTLLGVFLIGGASNFGRVYLMSTTGHRITQTLRKKVFTSIVRQEPAMFDKRSTGELVGRLSGNLYSMFAKYFFTCMKCKIFHLKLFSGIFFYSQVL